MPEEKRKKIESIIDSIKNNEDVRNLFWEEYRSLDEYVQKLIQRNVPELFPEN